MGWVGCAKYRHDILTPYPPHIFCNLYAPRVRSPDSTGDTKYVRDSECDTKSKICGAPRIVCHIAESPKQRRILQHTAIHCNTLQHDRSSLKRSGRYCHALQHTATRRIRGALLLSSLQSRKYTALHCVLQYVAATSYAACCSVTCACYFRDFCLQRVPRRASTGARTSRVSTYFQDKCQVSNKSTHTSLKN